MLYEKQVRLVTERKAARSPSTDCCPFGKERERKDVVRLPREKFSMLDCCEISRSTEQVRWRRGGGQYSKQRYGENVP